MNASMVQCCNVINATERNTYGDDKFLRLELKYGNKSKKDGFLKLNVYWCDEEW
jgi:hypothetical protein